MTAVPTRLVRVMYITYYERRARIRRRPSNPIRPPPNNMARNPNRVHGECEAPGLSGPPPVTGAPVIGGIVVVADGAVTGVTVVVVVGATVVVVVGATVVVVVGATVVVVVGATVVVVTGAAHVGTVI